MKPVSIGAILIFILHFCFLTTVEGTKFEDKIHLRLYKSGKTDFEQVPITQGETLFQESKGYNQSLPLVLLFHGMAKGADCNFVNGLIDAFVKRQLTNDYNIFAVDMPELLANTVRNQFYIGILANVLPAGQMIGEFLSKVIRLKLIAPESINIIGYSIGAQIAGYAARAVKNRFGEINFIAGLDPAGPGFHMRWGGHSALTHVSATDARTTHFYHTNSVSCGTRDRVATADFIFNKGTVQPGCTKEAGLDCSHVRVPDLYIEAVINPKNFIARKCSNWEKFRTCNCNNHETISITFPPDTSARGIYYLRTRANSPFALGKKGSRCSKVAPIQNDKDDMENTKLSDITPQPKMTGRIRESLHPKHKIKDNINMHMMNGIRKMEELQKQLEVYKQLDSSKKEGSVEESNENKHLNEKEVESTGNAKNTKSIQSMEQN